MTFMGFYNRFSDRKSKTVSAGFSASGGIASIKTLKNAFLIFSGNSQPGIVNQKFPLFTVGRKTDADSSLFIRIFKGIIKQYGNQLLNSCFITMECEGWINFYEKGLSVFIGKAHRCVGYGERQGCTCIVQTAS